MAAPSRPLLASRPRPKHHNLVNCISQRKAFARPDSEEGEEGCLAALTLIYSNSKHLILEFDRGMRSYCEDLLRRIFVFIISVKEHVGQQPCETCVCVCVSALVYYVAYLISWQHHHTPARCSPILA